MDSNEDKTLLKEIQKNVLLGEIPQDIHGVKIWVSTHLSEAMDSDFYEVIPHQEGVFDLILGDVMGKGIKAQVLATLIKELITKENLSLSEKEGHVPSISSVMEQVTKKSLKRLADEQVYATLFYGRFNLIDFQFEFLDFGYPRSIVLKKNGDRHFLKTDYFPLGMPQEKAIKEEAISIGQGDKFVFYSDGLVEAITKEGEPLGMGGVQALVEKCKDRSCKEIVDFVFEELKGCHYSQNDVTCMVLEVLTSKREDSESSRVEVVSRSVGVEAPQVIEEPVEEEPDLLEEEEEFVVEEEVVEEKPAPPPIAKQGEQEFPPTLEGLEMLLAYIEELVGDLPKNEQVQIRLITQKLGLLILQALSKSQDPSNISLATQKLERSVTLSFYYFADSPITEKTSGLNIIQKSVNHLKMGQDKNNRYYIEVSKRV